jgi:hypothetical protein
MITLFDQFNLGPLNVVVEEKLRSQGYTVISQWEH